MQPTKIEWCDYSSNPIYATVDGKRGWFCVKVSPGCAHCYSATMNMGRFGNGLDFLPANRERIEFHLNKKELREWQRPKYAGRKVFAFDMTDLFGEWVSDEWLAECFGAMAVSLATFLILTKRPDRMHRFCSDRGPLPNVWLGVTVENQRWADERIPILLDTPAAVRFVSAEPLLQSIDLTYPGRLLPTDQEPRIDWVICGGESGTKARPFNPDWARDLKEQCEINRTPFFMKQLGGLRPGNKLGQLPADLRVREWPR